MQRPLRPERDLDLPAALAGLIQRALQGSDSGQSGDPFAALAALFNRNRLAVIVLLAQAGAAGQRARERAVMSGPARWLSRNALLLRFYLRILTLRPCFPQAGYREIAAMQRRRRRISAPRLLRHRLDARAAVRAVRAVSLQHRVAPSWVSVY